MKNNMFLIFLIIILLLPVLVFAKKDKDKDKEEREYIGARVPIAVVDFENKSGYSGQWKIGEGMADRLVTELVKSKRFQIFEREQMGKVMEEQSLSMTGIITPQSATQLGQLIGVKYIVLGSVTEFGEEETKKGVSLFGKGISKTTVKGRIGLDVRMIDVETTEIIYAESVTKEKSSSALGFKTRKFDMNKDIKLNNTVVGEAVSEAITEIVEKLVESAANVPFEGKIIKLAGEEIYIKPGADGGLQEGDIFEVWNQGEELIDPDTGISLGSTEAKVATIEITQVLEKFSKAKVIDGGAIQSGDLVRVPLEDKNDDDEDDNDDEDDEDDK